MNLYGMTHLRVHLVPAPPCLPACLAPHPHPHPHPSAAGASGFDIAGRATLAAGSIPGPGGFGPTSRSAYSIFNIEY